MVLEDSFAQTGVFMRVIGKIINTMVKDSTLIRKAITLKESSKITNLKENVFLKNVMAAYTKDKCIILI